MKIELSWPDGEPVNARTFLSEVVADLIRLALIHTKGNQSAAARLLGCQRTTLGMKLWRIRIREGRGSKK